MTEGEVFAWLCLKYVQRSDERQAELGLQYTQAETHDLAREIARLVGVRVEAVITDIKAGLCCPRVHGCEQNDGEYCLVRQSFARAGLIAEESLGDG